MVELGVAVPFYNEENAASRVASDLVRALAGSDLDFELVLVDNGSTDATSRLLEEVAATDRRVRVLRVPENQGYGFGVRQGLRALRASTVGWTDGDGQVPPEIVVQLYRAMRHDGSTFGSGLRVSRSDGRFRRVASWGYRTLVRLLIGVHYRDINGKPKLLDRRLLEAVDPVWDDFFLDTEVVAGCLARGAQVTRLPFEFAPRRAGKSHIRFSAVVEFVRNLGAYRWGRRGQGRRFPSSSSAAEKVRASENLPK